MEPLIIEKTEDTPGIVLNPETNTFEITERSLPENAIDFYQPVFDWLKDYMYNPNDETIFHLKLEYYNTATAKQIAKILMLLEKLSTKSKVVIKWHYDSDDIDMYSSGSRFSKLINLNFEFIEHEED